MEVVEVARPFFNEVAGDFFRDGEAEDVLDLRGENHHGNAGGKSRGDGEWNEADKRPHAAEAQDNEKEARHQRADQQSGRVVLFQHAHDDDDEGAGGAAYLVLASAEQGNEEAGHDGGDEALGGRKPACNRKGHRQRNGHYADGEPREEVRQKGLLGIGLERGKESRSEHGCRDVGRLRWNSAAGGV